MKAARPFMRFCEGCGQPVDGDAPAPIEINGVTLDGTVLAYGKSSKRLLTGAAAMFRRLAWHGRMSHEAFAAIKQTEALSDQSTVYVCHLRKALRRIGAPLQIETIYGWGYRLLDGEGRPIAHLDKMADASWSGKMRSAVARG